MAYFQYALFLVLIASGVTSLYFGVVNDNPMGFVIFGFTLVAAIWNFVEAREAE